MAEKCTLAYQGTNVSGQLENISLNGAIISVTDSIAIPMGAIGLLTVYLKDGLAPLRLNVEIIHCSAAKLGMRLVPLDEYGQNCLVHLVESFTTEPEKLKTELERIKWHIAHYLRAS